MVNAVKMGPLKYKSFKKIPAKAFLILMGHWYQQMVMVVK